MQKKSNLWVREEERAVGAATDDSVASRCCLIYNERVLEPEIGKSRGVML
jgi:hypothetical protein